MVFVVEVPGRPRPQGSMTLWTGTDGKERAKYGDEVIRHRNLMVGALKAEWGDRGVYPDAVKLEVALRFTRPKSHYRTGRYADLLKDSAPVYMTSTPDADKCVRLVGDALVIAGVIADDNLIAEVQAVKVYTNEAPSTLIKLSPL